MLHAPFLSLPLSADCSTGNCEGCAENFGSPQGMARSSVTWPLSQFSLAHVFPPPASNLELFCLECSLNFFSFLDDCLVC